MPISDRPFFQFESDFVESLRCIPMIVRYKLDTSGVKLKLDHWNKFSTSDREQLVTHSCETERDIADYREMVRSRVAQYSDTPPKDLPVEPLPPWVQADKIPAEVQQQAAKSKAAIAPEDWAALSTLQRFALYKLSRSNHENRNFLPALREFGLGK